jgi:hypothetical protein
VIHTIACGSCGVKLSVPDEKLPAGLTHFRGKCPKCQNMIEVNLDRGGRGAVAPAADLDAASPASPAAPAPSPAAAPQTPPPPAAAPEVHDLDEDFVPGRRLALAAFEPGAKQDAARAALEGAGYTVHVPKDAAEAVARLRRSKYEVVLLDEAYGGSRQANEVLKALQPMPMSARRHMCVGLLGAGFKTFDNMAAFASSVNFVVGEKDLDKLKDIVVHAAHDHEHFYRPFLDALKEAGKA